MSDGPKGVWVLAFWEQILNDGIGEERIIEGRVVTYVPVTLEDAHHFPELGEACAKYVALWSDPKGQPHGEVVDRVPEMTDEDTRPDPGHEPNESGFTIHPVKD